MADDIQSNTYHTPALLEETIEALAIRPDGIYVDATFGGGGHSRAIVSHLSERGHLYGFDQDADALKNVIPDPRFTFVHSNFEFIPNFMRFYGVESVDGILADLGVSFHHFDDASRGFSFRSDSPLDMRMNQKSDLTAAKVIADYSESDLLSVFRLGTDLKAAPKIVRALIKRREEKPIETTADLLEVIKPFINPANEKKEMAQVFQALRIEVNHEMEALKRFLANCSKVLKPGGRLAVITYHSIEDRLVKNLMKSGNIDGVIEKDFFGNVSSPWKLITRSPITPSAEEIARNPRSRSAKLRVAELK